MRACAAGPSRVHTHAPATASLSPATLATRTLLRRQSRTSPRPTPTRTSATTRRSRPPLTKDGSRPLSAPEHRYRLGARQPRLPMDATGAGVNRGGLTPATQAVVGALGFVTNDANTFCAQGDETTTEW